MPTSTPSLPRSRLVIVAEAGGALLGGLLVSPVIGYGFYFMLSGAGIGMGLLALMIFAAVLGFGLGAGGGAALSGRLLGQPGSLPFAILGGVLSASLVILVVRLLNVGGLVGIVGIAVPLSVGAAVAGYHLGGHT